MKGIIINGECKDDPEGKEAFLNYYGVLEDGSNFLWRQSDPYLLLFSLGKGHEVVKGATKVVNNSFKTMDGRPASLHYFATDTARKSAAQSLGEGSCFEADIDPSSRYLMERGFLGRVDFGDSNYTTEGNLKTYEDPKATRTKATVPTTVLSLDIETGNGNALLYSIGLHARRVPSKEGDSDYRKVLMVGEGTSNEDFLKFFPDEKALLSAFVEEVHNINPQIFIGWNVVKFDFDFLVKKFDEHGIPFSIGVDGSPAKAFQGGSSRDLVVRMNGRLVMDGISTLRSLGIRLPDYRLDTAAKHILNKGKLISASGKSKVQEIEELFRNDKRKLAEYNLQDCVLVSDLFERIEAIEFRMRHLFLTGVYLEKQMGPAHVLDYLLLPKLHRKQVVGPNPTQQTLSQIGPSFGDIPEWKGGLYQHVIHIGFEQLLPSMVETFRVDPLGKMQAEIDKANAIKSPRGIPFHRSEHILPGLVAHYRRVVSDARKANDSLTARVAQFVLDSMLVGLRGGRSRFALIGLHDAITKNASNLVQRSVQALESWGSTVAYADHHGIFVAERSSDSLQETGNNLSTRLNTFLAEQLKKEFSVESQAQSYVVATFSKTFFLDQKPASLDKLEPRYVGLAYGGDGAGSLRRVEQGLGSLRREHLPIVVELQKAIVDDLLEGKDPSSRVRSFKQSLLAKEQDDHLVFERRLKKSVEEYQKGAPPHVVAASKIPGEKPFSVRYAMTTDGPEPTSHRRSPLDYEFYLTKQVKPMLQSVLVHTPYSQLIEEVTDLNDQLNLFAAN